jgi:hypothetical protein
VIFLAAVAAASGAAAQQPPRIQNAKLTTTSAAAGLEKNFRALVGAAKDAAWIGYAVAALPGQQSCCWDSWDGARCCGGCRLEGKSSFASRSTDAPDSSGTVRLEGDGEMLVLFRAEAGGVQKIRVFSRSCGLDAGGLAFQWLTDVRAKESIALLASFVPTGALDREQRRLADGAISAIALHEDAAADDQLERFASSDHAEELRKKAAFWMGNARGRRGYEALRKLAREDPSDKVREHVAFALTQSKEAEATSAIVDLARNDRSTRVRGQALFWLAQKAGERASQTIASAIEQDPETEVKKKAVFALSQLPRDEGVPLLIRTARTNRNPEVRKQAFFWLGQSKDPRALRFFEEVLAR